MKPSITFALNEMFKDSDGPVESFWSLLLDHFEFAVSSAAWPLIQRSCHVLFELRPFFECNGVYDLLREDKEDIRLVLQERKAYSGMTLKLTDEVKGIFPKPSWFVQRQPKQGNWKENMPLQNTFIFPWPDKDGAPCLWGSTRQADGIVHVVQKIKPTERGLTPHAPYADW